MMRLADVIAPLLDPDVDRIVAATASDIDTVAHVLNIDPHYLSVQVRIHMPFYDRTRLGADDGIGIIREVLGRLRRSLDDFGSHHDLHRQRNGIDSITPGSKVKSLGGASVLSRPDGTESPLRLGPVDPEIGFEIQREIHYIHSARTDTFLHAGLFDGDRPGPLAYAAFSPLDRSYLRAALERSGVTGPSNVGDVAVMTRAFGYNPLPKNAMSKLFEFAATEVRRAGYNYIITALNPLLGFKGSIFSGSSFVAFATSPMRYWYNNDGLYMNRRRASNQAIAQRLETPPIVWLVRGLDSRRQRAVERFSDTLYSIGEDEYDAR